MPTLRCDNDIFFDDDINQYIFKQLVSNDKTLQELNFGGLCAGIKCDNKETIQLFGKTIPINSEITRLVVHVSSLWSCLNVSGKRFYACEFIKGIIRSNSITSFEIIYPNLTTIGWIDDIGWALLLAIGANGSITSLRLKNTKLRLYSARSDNRKTKVYDPIVVLPAIENCQLINLELPNCNIDDSQMRDIASSLNKKTCLERLILRNNVIESVKGCTAIGDLIENQKSLQVINLESNAIDIAGVTIIIDSLTASSTLTDIILDGNIGFQPLTSNPLKTKLITLLFGESTKDESINHRVHSVIKSNHSLKCLCNAMAIRGFVELYHLLWLNEQSQSPLDTILLKIIKVCGIEKTIAAFYQLKMDNEGENDNMVPKKLVIVLQLLEHIRDNDLTRKAIGVASDDRNLSPMNAIFYHMKMYPINFILEEIGYDSSNKRRRIDS